MRDNSHFGLFIGAFSLMSLASVYGSEIGPALLAPEAVADPAAVSSWVAPRQLTLPPGLPAMIAEAPRPAFRSNILRPILAKAEIAEQPEAAAKSQSADEAGKGAVTVLPNASSCPSANPSTSLAPPPAADIAPLSGPVPLAGLGTGTPCPAAAPHTSMIAGASPSVVPSGFSAPSIALNAPAFMP